MHYTAELAHGINREHKNVRHLSTDPAHPGSSGRSRVSDFKCDRNCERLRVLGHQLAYTIVTLSAEFDISLGGLLPLCLFITVLSLDKCMPASHV